MDVAKTISAVAASVAALGGSYTLADKFGWFDKPILNWSPEHFEISDGSAGGEFKVIVARQKLRDDCEVTNFKIEIKDSDFVVHPASPSIATFSGPATPTVDKFGYKFTFSPERVFSGRLELDKTSINRMGPSNMGLINKSFEELYIANIPVLLQTAARYLSPLSIMDSLKKSVIP